MLDPEVCLYHANCVDGFGAAFAIWLTNGGTVRYIPVSYGLDPPWSEIDGKRVAIVDFSYKRAVMLEIASRAHSVLVIDHHKTAEEELQGLQAVCPNLQLIFDMEHSGAVLTWKYFHGFDFPPVFYQLIEDRDLWRHRFPYTDDFHMAIQAYPKDFTTWNQLFKAPVEDLLNEGFAIRRYFRTLVDYHKGMAHSVTIYNTTVPAVNAPAYVASEVAGELAEGHPFAGVYSVNGEKAYWSLRSREGGEDVSEYAKWFGGGGHRNAAGFIIPLREMVSVPGGYTIQPPILLA